MEQVLNTQERNTAFVKFLSFFLVTVALVVVAVYFDFRVPDEYNKKLLSASREQDKINEKEEQFVARMQVAVSFLDSLRKPGTDNRFIDDRLGTELTELFQLQKSANPLYDKLNANIVLSFLEIRRSKNARAEDEITIKKLRDQLAERQQLLDNLKGLNQSAPASER